MLRSLEGKQHVRQEGSRTDTRAPRGVTARSRQTAPRQEAASGPPEGASPAAKSCSGDARGTEGAAFFALRRAGSLARVAKESDGRLASTVCWQEDDPGPDRGRPASRAARSASPPLARARGGGHRRGGRRGGGHFVGGVPTARRGPD